jgi:hypothetical protein
VSKWRPLLLLLRRQLIVRSSYCWVESIRNAALVAEIWLPDGYACNVFPSIPALYCQCPCSYAIIASICFAIWIIYHFTMDQKYLGLREDYVFPSDGVCSGIIEEVYIPPVRITYSAHFFGYGGSSSYIRSEAEINGTRFQNYVESQLVNIIASLPRWLDTDCYDSLRVYFCSLAYLKPQYIGSIGSFLSLDSNSSESRNYYFTLSLSGVIDIGNYFSYATSLNASQLRQSIDENQALYAPSYPSSRICSTYATTCSAFIKDWASNLYGAGTYSQRWRPRCDDNSTMFNDTGAPRSSSYYQYSSSSGTGGIRAFPSANQTVAQLVLVSVPENDTFNTNFDLDNYLDGSSEEVVVTTLDLVTAPHTLRVATSSSKYSSWSVSCPYGYVVPTDPQHPRTQWMDGSGCAVACR